MKGLPLTRCVFLMPFADILTEIGAPTAKMLANHRLPTSLEENFEHFVPILPAIDFAVLGQRSQGIPDFGHLAGMRFCFDDLTAYLRTAVLQSPTLLAALNQLVKLAPIEDTNLRVWLEHDARALRVCSALAGTGGLPHLEHSQWLQNLPIISVVRKFLGPNWAPATMAFEAHFTPAVETQSHWPNTRFRTGEHASWIDIPFSMLSAPCRTTQMRGSPPVSNEIAQDSSDLIRMLRLMLPAYLRGRMPTTAQAAEMAGTSERSFQRQLSHAGLSYSGLIAQARYEVAAEMLGNSDEKIIEVAFAAGYSDPAHLARAFRRMAGVTPREYRRTCMSYSDRDTGRHERQIT